MDKIERIIKEIELLVKGEPFYSKLEKIVEEEKTVKEKSMSIKNEVVDGLKRVNENVNSEMKKLELEVKNCKGCELWKGRTNAVPGEGNYFSKLMIVGEGPGRDEDIQGRPFVGRAGQLLTKLLNEIGIDRKDVYITNVVKCRPPENRTPTPEEIRSCKKYLEKQFDLIKPKVVLILGSTALKAILGEEKITKVRGEEVEIDGIIFFPTFHPAAVLRDEQNKLPVIKSDFQKLKNILQKIGFFG